MMSATRTILSATVYFDTRPGCAGWFVRYKERQADGYEQELDWPLDSRPWRNCHAAAREEAARHLDIPLREVRNGGTYPF